MSPKPNDVQALERAILEEAEEEARQILAEAEAKAESIRSQAQAQANAEREAILQQAREEAKALHEHTTATGRLEAQTLKLKRRERLLERTFADAGKQLASAPKWPDYMQVIHHLVREAVERLGASEGVLRADEATKTLLSEEVLADLASELDVRLDIGNPHDKSSGVMVETRDGHRRYDNTLETRLARMRDILRTPVYRILMGEASSNQDVKQDA